MPVAFLSSHLEDNIDEYMNKYYKQDRIFRFFSFFSVKECRRQTYKAA